MAGRGISPVVAVLILIVIAVVAAIAVFGFIQGFIAQTTGGSEAPSNIVIDAASINDGTNTVSEVKAVVRNTGDFDTKVIAIYILHSGNLSLITYSDNILPDGDIPANQAKEIRATGLNDPNDDVKQDEFYVVKVVTEDGASASIRVRAD